MQDDTNDHEKLSKTGYSQIGRELIGQFKYANCGRVHTGLAEADVIAHVNEVNLHNTRSPIATHKISADDYRRCFECGTPSRIFLRANPGDAPFLSTLQTIIAPGTECGQDEQPTFIEGDGTFEIPFYVSYARHRRPATGQADGRLDGFQQETLRSQPESSE